MWGIWLSDDWLGGDWDFWNGRHRDVEEFSNASIARERVADLARAHRGQATGLSDD